MDSDRKINNRRLYRAASRPRASVASHTRQLQWIVSSTFPRINQLSESWIITNSLTFRIQKKEISKRITLTFQIQKKEISKNGLLLHFKFKKGKFKFKFKFKKEKSNRRLYRAASRHGGGSRFSFVPFILVSLLFWLSE